MIDVSPPPVCSLAPCTRDAWCRGLCQGCYGRNWRNGTLETPTAKVRRTPPVAAPKPEPVPKTHVVKARRGLSPAVRAALQRTRDAVAERPSDEPIDAALVAELTALGTALSRRWVLRSKSET